MKWNVAILKPTQKGSELEIIKSIDYSDDIIIEMKCSNDIQYSVKYSSDILFIVAIILFIDCVLPEIWLLFIHSIDDDRIVWSWWRYYWRIHLSLFILLWEMILTWHYWESIKWYLPTLTMKEVVLLKVVMSNPNETIRNIHYEGWENESEKKW